MTLIDSLKNDSFHRPALVEETASLLLTRRSGRYIDLTCGGGGHLKYISGLLEREAVLVGIDRDPEAVRVTKERLQTVPQKTMVLNSTFAQLDEVIKKLGFNQADGFLLDLGISSHQLDTAERGFSFTHEGPLDMRMGPDCRMTAEELINSCSEEELGRIFKEFGEEKRARRAARAVVESRKKARIETTARLKEVLSPVLAGRYLNASLARLFQAVRIELNQELEQLRGVLPKVLKYLSVGGRAVVISYHSLEDRLVKQFMVEKSKGCICPKNFPVCTCNRKPEIKILTKKPLRASPEEREANIRVRSARLRAMEKVA